MRTRFEHQWISSGQAAALLGVSSRNTVKNWLEGGSFPSARKTDGGHWRFLRSEVIAVRQAMDSMQTGPASVGGLELPDVEVGDEVEGLY